MKIFFFDCDYEWLEEVDEFLCSQKNKYELIKCVNDDELSTIVNTITEVDVAIIDLSYPKYSLLLLIRNFKLNFPSIRIILTTLHADSFKRLNLTQGVLRKMGIEEFLYKPYMKEKIQRLLENACNVADWHNVGEEPSKLPNGDKFRETDDQFTAIKIDHYLSGGINIFDLYIRNGKNDYTKVLSRGEKFDRNHIENLRLEKGIEQIYFKTQDRKQYINYTNTLLEKMLELDKHTGHELGLAQDITENLIDEIFIQGVNPEIVKESETLCNNLYNLIKENRDLHETLEDLFIADNSIKSHLFGTAFFASIICKHIDWASQGTINKLCLGALLHDIGKLRLPPIFLTLAEEDMNDEQFKTYSEHPKIGAEMIHKFPIITEAIEQIVYQHHERIDGSGFPHGISGNRIYPLARIVGVSSAFASFIARERLNPIQGIRLFVTSPKNVQRFDPNLMKALILGFISHKEQV